MDGDNETVNIVRYNTSKKLAQLNKVVQFLSYHLEERMFQIDFLRSSAERQQQRIFDDLRAKTSELYGGIDNGKVDLEKSLKDLYVQRVDDMRTEIKKKEDSVTGKVSDKMKEIQAEIAKGKAEIQKIMENLETQFAFLNDKTKCDVSSINIRIIQMKKDHQVALKQFDFDAKKKLKQGDEDSRKKLKELEADYQAQLERMKTDTRPDPSMKEGLAKALAPQKKKNAELRERMKELVKEVNQQKAVFQQNMAGFRNRLALFIGNATKARTAGEAKVKKAKEDMEAQFAKFEKEKKGMQDSLMNLRQQHENEIMAMKNQMKVARGNLKSELEKKKRSISNAQNANSGELSAFEEQLKKEMEMAKAEHDLAQKRYQDLLARLEKELASIDGSEVEKMEQSKAKLFEDNDHEIDQYNSDCRRQIERENNEFEEKRSKLESDLKTNGSIAADFAKNLEEKKRLMETLESSKRAYESSMKLLDAQTETQLRDQQRDLEEVVDQLKQANNAEYDAKSEEAQKSIAELQKTQDEEHERRAKELQEQYNTDIESINSSYQDESELARMRTEYEASVKDLETKLGEIVVPECAIGIDTASIEELRQKKAELPGKVTQEREQIISKWEKEANDEDTRHRECMQSFVYEQKEDEIPALQSRRKELAQELDNEITALSTNLKNLQLIAPLCHYANDPVDAEQERLKQEIDRLRDERKQRVKQALAFSEQTRNEFQAKIDEAAKAAEDALNVEKDREQAEDVEMHNKFEELRQQRKDASAQAADRNQRLQQFFDEKFDASEREFGKSMENKKQAIVHAQIQLDTDEKQLAFQAEQARLKLEGEMMKLEGVLTEQLEQLKANPAKVSADIEKMLEEAQKRLAEAQAAYENRPMREEEYSVIERLENNLQLQTNHLATVGKDLIQYRQHLIQQEEEYNGRFGADPAVAVMRVKPPCRRPISTFQPKRLPKLYSVS